MTAENDKIEDGGGFLQVGELDHVALWVGDLAVSERWYREVLGLVRKHEAVWGESPVFLSSGHSGIALFKASQTTQPLDPAASRTPRLFDHCAWRVGGGHFLRFQERLSALGIAFEFQDHQISRSIYFRDPDGHELEITTYDL